MILEEQPTWSIIDPSKMQAFMACPRKFFYEYVLGWRPEMPNNHLVFGEAWHHAMEHLLLNGYHDDAVVDAYQKFEECYRASFAPETDEMFEPKTPFNAFLVLQKYAEKYAEDLDYFDVLYTEIAGTVTIGQDRMMDFRMDSVIKDNTTGMHASLEHKTGSRLWMWAEQWLLSMQVSTYTHVLHCLYPEDEVEGVIMNGCFFIKRKKDPFDFSRVPTTRSRDQMDTWLFNANYWYDQIQREMELLVNSDADSDLLIAFPLNTTNCLNYGRVCEYHDYCLAWPNPLQKCGEPPLGFKIEHWNPRARDAKVRYEL